jgi:hypothetical protein
MNLEWPLVSFLVLVYAVPKLQSLSNLISATLVSEGEATQPNSWDPKKCVSLFPKYFHWIF